MGATIREGSLPGGQFPTTGKVGDYGAMCMLGTFSQYGVIHQNSCVKVDDDLPLEKAVLVGCGVPTAVADLRISSAARDRVAGAVADATTDLMQVAVHEGLAQQQATFTDLVVDQKTAELAAGFQAGAAPLQVAARASDAFADGIWLVELAPIEDGDLVAASVLAGLGGRAHPEHGGGDPAETCSAARARICCPTAT